MDISIAIIALITGYLLGSISFARLIIRIVAPQADITRVVEPVPNTNEVFVFRSVSATSVRYYAGNKMGCLTSVLDMLKAFLPTLLFRLLFPEMPYFLIAASAVILGHNFPIFHGFKGGRGESPILGSLLAVDPIGLFILNVVGMLTGALVGNLMVMHWTGYILMIPWLWLRTGDPWHLGYILLANGLYWFALVPELKQYIRLIRTNQAPSQEETARFLGMGKRLGRFLDRYSLPALYLRWRKQKKGE